MALSLPEATETALRDLAEALGKPAATVATDLLTEMVPHLHGLAKVARATKAGNQAAAKRAISHLYGDAFAELAMSQQQELPITKGKRK